MINEPIASSIYNNPYLNGRNDVTHFHLSRGGWVPPNRDEGDLLELGWIPEEYINEYGKVKWVKVREDAEAVRLARKLSRGQEILGAKLFDFSSRFLQHLADAVRPYLDTETDVD